MNVVEHLDEGARRVLAAHGLAAKLVALGYSLHAVSGWARERGRRGVASSLQSSANIVDQLGGSLGRLAAENERRRRA